MQRVTLLFVCLLSISGLSAQTCMPDTTLPDGIFILPAPFQEGVEGSGIMDTVCLNVAFEEVFTMNVPETFTFQGVTLGLESLELNPTSAITNIPDGLEYNCNPPNCIFPAGTFGCIVLYGTVTDPLLAGTEVNLVISGQANLSAGPSLNLSFPDDNIAPGRYLLHIQEENSTYCRSVDADEAFRQQFSMQVRPNPVQSTAELVVESAVAGDFQLAIHDMVGRQMMTSTAYLTAGSNAFTIDVSRLAAGMYLYSLTDGTHRATGRLIVQE